MGVCGSSAPWNTTSFMFGLSTRTIRNRSASAVSDDTNSLAAMGPVISVSALSGVVKNVTPSPNPL